MKIEDKIRNNRDSLDFFDLPEGHEKRFTEKLKFNDDKHNVNIFKIFLITVSSAAAILIMFFLVNNLILNKEKMEETVDEDYLALQTMRSVYDEKLESAIFRLEEILENVDDSTRNEISLVIDELLSTSDELAAIAPMPFEKQMAITSHVYDSKLRVVNLISDKLENVDKNE